MATTRTAAIEGAGPHEDDARVTLLMQDFALALKVEGRDEHTLTRSVPRKRTSELLNVGTAHGIRPAFGLHVNGVETEAALLDDSVDALIAAPADRAPGILQRAALANRDQ